MRHRSLQADRSRRAPVILSAALVAMALSRAADASPDEWLGPDKALHFHASLAIATLSYALSTTMVEQTGYRLLIGGGTAICAGAAKELADLAGLGEPSWGDFVWGLAGAAVGLAVSWLVVRLIAQAHGRLRVT